MTEFVQRETNTLKEQHQQFEETQLACTRQASVRNRNVADRHRDEVQNILTEVRTQRNSESLANAATVLTIRKGLDAFKLVIEQLSQSCRTSVKITVETVQYASDSTYKVAQEERTEVEGMLSVIQSEFE